MTLYEIRLSYYVEVMITILE